MFNSQFYPHLIFFPPQDQTVNTLNEAKKNNSISEQLKPTCSDSNKTYNNLLSAWKNNFIVYWTREIVIQLYLLSSKVSACYYPYLTLWKNFFIKWEGLQTHITRTYQGSVHSPSISVICNSSLNETNFSLCSSSNFCSSSKILLPV